ncbi:MAG: hypothetical protein U0Q16_31205 [Bryobacteraceae bacterium]
MTPRLPRISPLQPDQTGVLLRPVHLRNQAFIILPGALYDTPAAQWINFAERGYTTMFDSLEEQIRHDIKESSSPKERAIVWVTVAVASVALFGGLYYAVQLLS